MSPKIVAKLQETKKRLNEVPANMMADTRNEAIATEVSDIARCLYYTIEVFEQAMAEVQGQPNNQMGAAQASKAAPQQVEQTEAPSAKDPMGS